MGRGYKIGLTLGGVLLLLLAQQGMVDRVGMQYTETTFKRALLTFAVARGLNAVISVAQGTEVAVQPAGVGINFTPGEVLDPINDLIERFSWVMLASSTSLGLQRLLLQIFASTHYTLLLGLTLVGALLLLWRRGIGWEGSTLLLYRVTVMLLVLRFAVPVMALGNELLFTTFLQPQYESATQELTLARDEIGRINRDSGAERLPEEDSLLGRARGWYQSAIAGMDLEAMLQRYQEAAAAVSEQLIQLIVIFLLQTVLLPLLFLWGGARLLRHIATLPRPW